MRLCVRVYVCAHLYIYIRLVGVSVAPSLCVRVRVCACVCIVHTWVHIALDDGISKRMRVIDTKQQQQQQQCLSTNSTHTSAARTHTRILSHPPTHISNQQVVWTLRLPLDCPAQAGLAQCVMHKAHVQTYAHTCTHIRTRM